MGLLEFGTLLSWDETRRLSDDIRRQAVNQFLNIYHRVKYNTWQPFTWGDEVEYMIVKVDNTKKTASLVFKNCETVSKLQKAIQESPNFCGPNGSNWMTETASHALESTPGIPFTIKFSDFGRVEGNMSLRRKQASLSLNEENGETCLTITSFPRVGCPAFSYPAYDANPVESKVTKSLFLPDEALCPLPRYIGEEQNVRARRGEQVSANVPIFKDVNTPSPFVEDFRNDFHNRGKRCAKPDHIYADSTVFGLGFASLQVTMQAFDLTQAKDIHDQLIPICPILIALSAASPIVRGYLSEIDSRWSIIRDTFDCRTKDERRIRKDGSQKIPKSRFDTASYYLAEDHCNLNDIPFPYNKDAFNQLIEKEVDHNVAKYFSNMFIRDPLYLLKEHLDQNDRGRGHLDNLLSTHCPSIRLKVPCPEKNQGWRVEVRPMDVQLTDFENAALNVFVMLLTRALIAFNFDITIPISKVDDNIDKSQKRNAITEQKFYFKPDLQKNITTRDDVLCCVSVDTIINGGLSPEGCKFRGLVPIIKDYITTLTDVDDVTLSTVTSYLQLVSDRASGKVRTTARWIRDFVQEHPGYEKNSVVTEEINYDLIKLCSDIASGRTTRVHLETETIEMLK